MVNHRPVAEHDGQEGRLVTSRKHSLDELAVGLDAEKFRRHAARQTVKKITHICRGHRWTLLRGSALCMIVPAGIENCSPLTRRCSMASRCGPRRAERGIVAMG